MAFDPSLVDKYKKPSQPVTASGFDPSLVDKYKGRGDQAAAPQPDQARPGRIGRAADFVRRAFMGDSVEPAKRNVVQNAFNDAEEMITGGSHLIGQGLVEGTKLAGDVVKSIGPMALKSVLGAPATASDVTALPTTPIGKRIAAFPGQVAESISPEGRKIAKEDFISPAVESFKNSFKHPIRSFKEHPLFTFIDWSTALDLAGSGVRTSLSSAAKGAKIAGKAELAGKIADTLSTVREPLEVAPRGQILREFSKNPLVKMGIQKPLDKIAANPALQEFVSSKPIMQWLLPSNFTTPEARAGQVAGKVVQNSQSEFYRMRNARMEEAVTQFNKLPKNERETFVAVVQGRAMPVERQFSPQFKEVYDWYKNVVADEQTRLNLPDETVKRVAYQPLAIANGLLTPEDYKLAMRGDANAAAKVRQVTDNLAESRIRIQEDAIKEWMGVDKRTKQFKSLARELTENASPDPIYFPSVFENKIKIADFLPNRFLQRFKPGFMKGRTGVFGFIEKDPEAAFAIHQSQVERYLQNEHLINTITDKFAVPLKKASDLKPGWKAFAPDGYLGFYRGSMPLQEAFLRGVGMGQDVDSAFLAAVKKVMPDIVTDKPFVGVRRPKIYQIPAQVAREAQEAMAPTTRMPEAIKLFYDKPLQAFKYSVLGLSPRWMVNNTVGNIVTTMSGRVSPEAFINAGKQVYKDLIPEEVASGGFRRSEFPSIKKIMTPETGFADKVTGFFSGETPTEGVLKNVQNVVSTPVKAVGKISSTIYEANSKIEDTFRNATFIDRTTKAAVEKIAKDTSKGIFDMRSKLDRFLERGSFADSNVAKTAKEMLQNPDFKDHMVGEVNRILNDYNSLSKWERSAIRRIVPFWSWWKFVNVLFWSMPVKDPAMAQTLKQLGMAGNEIAAKEWKANGLNVDEIPEWMRGNVILSRTPDGKLLDMLSTRSINPFSQAHEPPSLAPQFQLFEEQRSGRKYLTGDKFTHPNEIEVKGSIYRKEGGKTKRIDHPTPPPIVSHILRQFPQINILEALAFPYRTYSGEGIFNNAINAYKGRVTPLRPDLKIAGILGMPVTEADYRRLRQSHMDANRAELLINKQMRRSNKSLERIKLGAEQ